MWQIHGGREPGARVETKAWALPEGVFSAYAIEDQLYPLWFIIRGSFPWLRGFADRTGPEFCGDGGQFNGGLDSRTSCAPEWRLLE